MFWKWHRSIKKRTAREKITLLLLQYLLNLIHFKKSLLSLSIRNISNKFLSDICVSQSLSRKPLMNWPSSSREELIHFDHFAINCPWKRAWSFIWTNINSIHNKCVENCKVDLEGRIFKSCQNDHIILPLEKNWPSGSWEMIFNSYQYILTI